MDASSSAAARDPLLDQRIADTPFAVVDVETTGLDPERGDRVVEVAVLRAVPGGEPEVFASLVNPGRRIHPAASAVNGITDADLADAPPFSAVAEEVSRRIQGAVFVAHNAPFDQGFLNLEYREAGMQPPTAPVVDTLMIARQHFNFRRNGLGNVARALGVPSDGAHRAEADVRMTYGVLLAMLKVLVERGASTVEDLIQTQRMGTGSAVRFSPKLGEPLATAVREKRTVTIRYRSRGARASTRVIDPIGQRGPYVVAYCHLRRAERTFRIDRIEGAWWP